MTIDLIKLWHEKARQWPTDRDFQVQLGCHFEEIAEMMEALVGNDEYAHVQLVRANAAMWKMATLLKSGATSVSIQNRADFLDAIADQIVTGTGAAHCANMNVTEAVRRVNDSNWTKFVNGEPKFDKHGKVVKSENYVRPDLTGLY